jgi:glycerol uptake facilitator-like aquaporin
MFNRKKIAMVVAEFLGTAILTLVMLAVSKSTIGIPYFVAIAAGLAVAGGMLVFGSVSGAQFNPAITIGLWSARRIKTMPAIVYVAAQLLGGIAAYWLFTYFAGQHWQNSGHYSGHVLVAEAAGTFVFSMAWAALSYHKLESGNAAAIVGIGLAVGIIVASSAASGILNPAVALGLRLWGWGTYVLGPVLGAVIGVNVYSLLFAPVEGSKNSSSKKK